MRTEVNETVHKHSRDYQALEQEEFSITFRSPLFLTLGMSAEISATGGNQTSGLISERLQDTEGNLMICTFGGSGLITLPPPHSPHC